MKRTIAAILAADVAGYSRLIAEDEDDTLTRLGEYGAVFREQVSTFDGRVFNTAGDAILAEFPSAVEALRAAIAIQERLRELNRPYPASRRVQFRMGLNIGDVVQRDGDMLGDGVNVAARLEGIAETGGICISRSVHDAIAARVQVRFKDIGPQKLKNIPRPVHAFRVILPSDGTQEPERRSRRAVILRWSAAALVLLCLAGGGGVMLRRYLAAPPETATAEAAPAPDRPDLMSVSVVKAGRACFQDQVLLSGTIVARHDVEVRPEREGLKVVRVLAEPLAEVAAGQVLAQLARADGGDGPTVELRAPLPGIVGRSTAVAGAPASAYAPALFQIVGQGEYELAAEVPLSAMARLSPGLAATVTPLGQGDLPGRVRTVSPVVDGGTQLGRVRVLLRSGRGLRPGVFARGVVTVAERCGIAVPAGAIQREADASIVYIARGNRIEARPVTTGLSSGNRVEIRDGLDGSEAVVLRAGPFLREGDTVHAIVAASAE